MTTTTGPGDRSCGSIGGPRFFFTCNLYKPFKPFEVFDTVLMGPYSEIVHSSFDTLLNPLSN